MEPSETCLICMEKLINPLVFDCKHACCYKCFGYLIDVTDRRCHECLKPLYTPRTSCTISTSQSIANKQDVNEPKTVNKPKDQEANQFVGDKPISTPPLDGVMHQARALYKPIQGLTPSSGTDIKVENNRNKVVDNNYIVSIDRSERIERTATWKFHVTWSNNKEEWLTNEQILDLKQDLYKLKADYHRVKRRAVKNRCRARKKALRKKLTRSRI